MLGIAVLPLIWDVNTWTLVVLGMGVALVFIGLHGPLDISSV